MTALPQLLQPRNPHTTFSAAQQTTSDSLSFKPSNIPQALLTNRELDNNNDDSQAILFSQTQIPTWAQQQSTKTSGNIGDKENNGQIIFEDDDDMEDSSNFENIRHGMRKPLSVVNGNLVLPSSVSDTSYKDATRNASDSPQGSNTSQNPKQTPPSRSTTFPQSSRYFYTYLSRPTIVKPPTSLAPSPSSKTLRSDFPTDLHSSSSSLALRRLSMHIGDVERVLEAFASRAGTFEESLGKAIARFDEVRVSAAKEMEAMNAVSEEGRMERALESSVSKFLVPTLTTLRDSLLTTLSDNQETNWTWMQSTLKETQNYRTKEESRRQQADEVAQAEMMKKIEILKRELGAQRRMLETVVEQHATILHQQTKILTEFASNRSTLSSDLPSSFDARFDALERLVREAILRMTTTPQPCRPMAGAVAIPSADVEEIRPATPADTVVRQARSTRSWRSVEEWVTHTVDDGIGSGRKGCDRASGYTGDGEQKGRAVAVVSSKVASSKTLGRSRNNNSSRSIFPPTPTNINTSTDIITPITPTDRTAVSLPIQPSPSSSLRDTKQDTGADASAGSLANTSTSKDYQDKNRMLRSRVAAAGRPVAKKRKLINDDAGEDLKFPVKR